MTPSPALLAGRPRVTAPAGPSRPTFRKEPRTDKALAEAHACGACGVLVSPGVEVCAPCWLAIPRRDRRVLREAFQHRAANPDAAQAARALTIVLAQQYALQASA